METTSFTFPGPTEDGSPILSFIRCRPRKTSRSTTLPTSTRRLALLALHAVGSHKEAWLPTVEHLFEEQAAAPPNTSFFVEEFWSMDCPDHGESAILNSARPRSHPESDGYNGFLWAKAANTLIASAFVSPGTTLVGLGHSAGACVIILATAGYPTHRLPFASLILVEPAMMTREEHKRFVEKDSARKRAMDMALVRKDIWPSRAEAHEWFARRAPWKRWDPRALQLYVEHALCDLPSPLYPETYASGVALSTTRIAERAGYSHDDNAFMSLEMLKDICPAIPVHTIYGSNRDLIPEETQRAIVSAEDGRCMASVDYVPGAGHLIVQERPRELARAIWTALASDFGTARGHSEPKSRL